MEFSKNKFALKEYSSHFSCIKQNPTDVPQFTFFSTDSLEFQGYFVFQYKNYLLAKQAPFWLT
jgi:hypothetical protein